MTIVAFAVACAALTGAAFASSPIRLYLNEGDAFAILGHSCGGIQQQVYARGFGGDGYPTGNVYMQTRCGGSGRGGGYKTTTYSGTATVVWNWVGQTRSYGTLQGPLEALSAEDGHGDRVYNVGTTAYLEAPAPPLAPPSAPTEVRAGIGLFEAGENEYLRMSVSWTPAPETAGMIESSTVTAVPVGSSAPTLSTTVDSGASTAYLQPVQPNTSYRVTVTNTDAEGTSPPSAPIEVMSPNEDGEAEREHKSETCERDEGTIKLSPGLTEVPHVQNITVDGKLTGCDGPLGFESGKYVAHLQSSEEVTCGALGSASLEPGTVSMSLSLKWMPSEQGASKGSLVFPLSETSFVGLSGTLEGGPFTSPTAINASSLFESFTGASSCGQAVGKKAAKPVKKGVFSSTEVGFG